MIIQDMLIAEAFVKSKNECMDGTRSIAADFQVNSMQPWQCVEKETTAPEYMYQLTDQRIYTHQLMRSREH